MHPTFKTEFVLVITP